MTDLSFDDFDNDHPDPSDDEFEDERAALRGTSQCDGTCDPLCQWCSIAHDCPSDCAGNECPYVSLEKELSVVS